MTVTFHLDLGDRPPLKREHTFMCAEERWTTLRVLWPAIARMYNTATDFADREEALDLLVGYATSYEIDGKMRRGRYDGEMPRRVAAVLAG